MFLCSGLVARDNQQELSNIRVLGDVGPKIRWSRRCKRLRVIYGRRDLLSVSRALNTSKSGNAVDAVHPVKRAVMLPKLSHVRTRHRTKIEGDRKTIHCASQGAHERINGAGVLKRETGGRLERAVSYVINIC